uniref:Uncharacterized protein n=1 Tax=Acrobeloides nanus TaxID=290746 RepID=A0A914C8J1_9BILA
MNNTIERHTMDLIEELRLDEQLEENLLNQNESILWEQLYDKFDQERHNLTILEKLSRHNLRTQIETQRQNVINARKLRHDQRRIQHQNDMKDLWNNELIRLNTTIHQRRSHFKHEIEKVQNIRRGGKPYDIVVGFDYDQVEVIPGTVETFKQQCCDRFVAIKLVFITVVVIKHVLITVVVIKFVIIIVVAPNLVLITVVVIKFVLIKAVAIKLVLTIVVVIMIARKVVILTAQS